MPALIDRAQTLDWQIQSDDDDLMIDVAEAAHSADTWLAPPAPIAWDDDDDDDDDDDFEDDEDDMDMGDDDEDFLDDDEDDEEFDDEEGADDED